MGTTRALGYVRVSTDEQAATGYGLAAQRKAIRDECARRGWDLVEIVGEAKGASGKSMDRIGVQSVLTRMDAGDADVLIVSKLDRLSRSLLHGAAIMEQAKRKGWALVAIDLGVDMSSASGELLAGILLTAAQFERRLIGDRTKAGLERARAAGVVLGRRQTLSEDVVRRIVSERATGLSLPKIAAALTVEGVPTARGGPSWYPSTVAAVLRSQAAQAITT